LITEEELRQYFLFIKNVKHYSRNTSTVASCGIKLFFEKTLNREWATFGLLRAPREKKLPVILSREEVRQILGRVRLPRYKVCLTTIYSCGRRLQEGTHLQVVDIESARLMIHIRHGKGAAVVCSVSGCNTREGPRPKCFCCFAHKELNSLQESLTRREQW